MTLLAPYPGLRAFRRSEAQLFFGRDDCINEMIDRLAATRFLAVLGSSGTGKSSLVKAGLLEALELGLMAPAGSRWRIVDFRLQDAPLRSLARRLLETRELQAPGSIDVELLRTFLSRGPRSVIEWCRAKHLSAGENLLLLVDQFEELFRYQDYLGCEEARAFVELLLESSHNNEFPIYVAITMRSEFLGACALIDGLAEEINAGMYLTPRMTREQCREAIVGPATLCNIHLDDALVTRLLNDLASFAPWDTSDVYKNNQLDRLVRRADQLPLLQYTLNRMCFLARERPGEKCVKLGLTDYKGLSFALNEHADEIFERLDKEKLPVETVFRALTSGTSIADAVRRPTQFYQLVAICGGDESAVRKVVNAYAAPECNFLLPEFDPLTPFTATTIIDISHESLIRQWDRLSQWVSKESGAGQQWQRLNDRFILGEPLRGRELANLIAWREETKPNAAWAKRYGGDYSALMAYLDNSNAAEKKSLWMRTATVVSMFAIILLAALFSFYQKQSAETNLAQAQRERERAEGNYAITKERLAGLTIAGVGSGEEPKDMLVIEVADTMQKFKETLNRLEADNPNDNDLERIRVLGLEKFVKAYRATGAYNEAARDTAVEVTDSLNRLAAREPYDLFWPQHLSLNLSILGDLLLHLDDVAGAGKSYEDALAIDRALVLREPENQDFQTRMSIGLVKVGNLQLHGGDQARARISYEEALAINRKLAATFPLIPSYQRDVSSTLDKIAELDVGSGDTRRGLHLYQEKLTIDRQLIENIFNQEVVDDWWNISLDLKAIGRLQLQIGHEQDARRSYEERLIVLRDPRFESLLSGIDSELELNKQIADTSKAIGNLQLRAGELASAKDSYKSAFNAGSQAELVAHVTFIGKRNGAKSTYIEALGNLSSYALLTNQPQVAAHFAELALKLDPSQVWIDIYRAHAYLFLGRHDDAKTIYLATKDRPKGSDSTKTYGGDIRNDFDRFRQLGITTPDGDRIAKEISI